MPFIPNIESFTKTLQVFFEITHTKIYMFLEIPDFLIELKLVAN